MELETMFTEQKWNILKCLSEEKFSPFQLAEKLNTTMANISQQLRLLEASNLVKKEKIKNRDKGKPRTLFSLTYDHAYLISAMNSFADKRLLKVTDHHKVILRIWFLENGELQYEMERLYWSIHNYIKQIDLIAINENTKEVLFISDKAKELEKIVKNNPLNVNVFSKKDAERLIKQGKGPFSSINELTIIHDSGNMLKDNGGGDK